MTSPVRVGVVGAGPAGLCAAKHSREAGYVCTVFEQSGALGGNWQYTDCVGTDDYGVTVQTSMYRGLRINLPKEITVFPDLAHKNKEESYLTSEEILEYLNEYTDKFDLRPLCKFHHSVQKIRRKESEWEVSVMDYLTKTNSTHFFDVLFICNGINNIPHTPLIKGSETFKGHSLHSHDFRQPEPFRGQRVLIVGGGPSAQDLTEHISRCADKVIMSHHNGRLKNEGQLRENTTIKPDISKLSEHSVEFEDGSSEDIDVVVYCTGYNRNYRFLDESCGITEDDELVYPLYKHFINANHPSMCVLGNLVYCMQFPTFDLQVRFFLKSLKSIILPTREDMLKDIKENMERKLVVGAPNKALFRTTTEEDRMYFNQLAAISNLDPVLKVILNIQEHATIQLLENFPRFRGNRYEIIDNETFLFSPAK